jgi:putative tryptophan/tyrosine transport system substrate-binding protein
MTQIAGVAGLIFALLVGVCSPPIALAQQPAKVARIGYLSLESAPALYLEAFHDGLNRLGYVDGRSIVVESRLAEGKTERLATLASELVTLKLDAIVGADGASARAISSATKSIPIVMGVSGDPVELGLALSLARPGGNVTGISFLSPELAGKRLQFLREVSPKVTKVAVLTNRVHAGEEQERNAAEAAARSVNLTLHFLPLSQSNDLAQIFAAITRERVDAIVAIAGPMTLENRKQIAEFAIKTRLPMIAGWAEYAEAGSLISYGPNRRHAVRHLAYFVDRIVRGAKPADLPVERPTRLELIVNAHTAKALGVTIPASLLLQADRVIE